MKKLIGYLLVSSALVVAIVYGFIITLDRNALSAELASVKNVLTTTQVQLDSTRADLDSTKQTLLMTQSELGSTRQTLASTQSQLSITKQLLTSTQAELDSSRQTLTSTQAQLTSTNQKLSSIQTDLVSTKTQVDAIGAKLKLYEDTTGTKIYASVQPRIQRGDSSMMRLNNNAAATDPSWQQLMSFLLTDTTDDKIYWRTSFDCVDFAEMLHDNAERAGIRAAFVAVNFENATVGHAINAFETSDRGLVYVDSTGPTFTENLQEIISRKYGGTTTEFDKIAYLMKGKEFGTISIDKPVSSEYSYYQQNGKALSDWATMGVVRSIQIYW